MARLNPLRRFAGYPSSSSPAAPSAEPAGRSIATAGSSPFAQRASSMFGGRRLRSAITHLRTAIAPLDPTSIRDLALLGDLKPLLRRLYRRGHRIERLLIDDICRIADTRGGMSWDTASALANDASQLIDLAQPPIHAPSLNRAMATYLATSDPGLTFGPGELDRLATGHWQDALLRQVGQQLPRLLSRRFPVDHAADQAATTMSVSEAGWSDVGVEPDEALAQPLGDQLAFIESLPAASVQRAPALLRLIEQMRISETVPPLFDRAILAAADALEPGERQRVVHVLLQYSSDQIDATMDGLPHVEIRSESENREIDDVLNYYLGTFSGLQATDFAPPGSVHDVPHPMVGLLSYASPPNAETVGGVLTHLQSRYESPADDMVMGSLAFAVKYVVPALRTRLERATCAERATQALESALTHCRNNALRASRSMENLALALQACCDRLVQDNRYAPSETGLSVSRLHQHLTGLLESNPALLREDDSD